MRSGSACNAIRLLLALASIPYSACSYALRPHQTLDGQAFRWDLLETISPGTSESDLVAALGRPLEVKDTEPDAQVWRYYERAQLRGCRTEILGFIPWSDTPIRAVEARVTLRAGVVERVDVTRRQ